MVSDLDNVKYDKKNEKIVAELEVESPNLLLKNSEEKLPQFKNGIEISGEKEEVRSSGVNLDSDDKFGDEWVPISLKKAMANVLGQNDEKKSADKEQKNRSPKALARDRKKIALMDALIDLARKMAKKKAKERAHAKQEAKEREEFESALLSTFTPPRISASLTNDTDKKKDIVPNILTTLAPPIASTRPPRDSKLNQLYPENHDETDTDDYDDTVWHRNPFRSEQDPVTRRTRPQITTARPTPTTIRFPLEEFLEDTITNPLVDDGLLEDNNAMKINDMKDKLKLGNDEKEKTEMSMEDPEGANMSKEEITTQRPRSPKAIDLNDESFDRGRTTLATLATLTDAELNEEFNLVGQEGVSTQPTEPLKEVRTIIVRRDKGGNFKVNGKDVNKILSQSPKITPLPDVFRLKDRKKQNSEFASKSTPSPIAILGGTDFTSLTVQPTQSTLRTLKFNPTKATVDFGKSKSENSILDDEDTMRKGKDVNVEDEPETAKWVWQTKEMDENGNEVITDTERLVKDNIISKLHKHSSQDTKDDFSPTVQLTEDDFVLLGDSWFKDKDKLSQHLKMPLPEVLTLPSEPVPTSSNMDIHEDDPRSSPSPHQAIKRLDIEPHAQPLELINPFISSNPSLTIAPPTVSSIAFPKKSSRLTLQNDIIPIDSDSENAPYSLEENVGRSKNWVLLSSPHNGNYDYEFDSIDAIETYDDYYNNDEYDDENEIYDLNRKIEKESFDSIDGRKSKHLDERPKGGEKTLKADDFRPSINLNSILPTSNRFLPLRSNGALFKEFVNNENRRNKDFEKISKLVSSDLLPLAKGSSETSLEGDYRLTSFDAIPLRTNAKTLHQLVSDSPWSSKSSPVRTHDNARFGKNIEVNEVHTGRRRNQSSKVKSSQNTDQVTSTGKNSKNNKSVSKKSHSKDDLSSRRTKKVDLDDLMVYYPLHGQPFLSFPPSKSFSTIAKYKRQIY